MTKAQAFKLSLPKWSQCIISGDPITEEQALEIIRRTDSFMRGGVGNNKHFIEKANSILRIPQIKDYPCDREGWDRYYEDRESFQKKWGFINLEYLSNHWVSSPWVGGPNGWCHPDGTIAYRHNIGKWPEVKDIYNELRTIATEFPFLSFTCTLVNGEEEEVNRTSVVSFKISRGKIRTIDTIPRKTALIKCDDVGVLDKINPAAILGGFVNRENYFSLSRLQCWADKVYKED